MRKCPRVVARGPVCFRYQTMSTNELSGQERTDDAPYPSADRIAGRIRDGASEFMHVERHGPGVYRVDSGSGNSYDVDLESGMCTCPDAGTRGPWCKHFFAVLFRTDELPAVVGSGVVPDEKPDEDDDPAEASDEPTTDEEDDDTDTLAERVERFEANNPGASAIEAVSTTSAVGRGWRFKLIHDRCRTGHRSDSRTISA
jgi:hypothetical protein